MDERIIPRFITCRKHFSTDDYIIGAMTIKFRNTNLPEIEKKSFNQIKVYYKIKIISLDNNDLLYNYTVINNQLQLKRVYCNPEEMVPDKNILSDLFELTETKVESVECKDCMCNRYLSDCINCIWIIMSSEVFIKTDFGNYKKGDIIDSPIIICFSSSLLFIKEDIFGLYLSTKEKGESCKYIEQNLYNGIIKEDMKRYWDFNPFDNVSWFNNFFTNPILKQDEFDKCYVNLNTSRNQFVMGDLFYLSSIYLHVGEKIV